MFVFLDRKGKHGRAARRAKKADDWEAGAVAQRRGRTKVSRFLFDNIIL